ncbi:MAG TPA: hypothetical protein VK447_07520 [Myxococcaceae bacterium]|nr:hypothetical protein [Myxococcaceae bacterium]
MRLRRWAVPLCLLMLAFEARAQPAPVTPRPSPQQLVADARVLLADLKVRLAHAEAHFGKEDLAKIRADMEATEKALEAYARKVEQPSSPPKTLVPALTMAAGAVVADDASGIGVADDVLLPAIALLILVESRLAIDPKAFQQQVEGLSLDTRIRMLLFGIQQVTLAKKKNDGKCHCQCAGPGVRSESQGRKTLAGCKARCNFLGFPVHICK